MRLDFRLRLDARLRPTGRQRRLIDCSRRFDANRRKPSQHAEKQGISATRWRRPLPEGRNRAKTTPKRFMDETSRADAGLRLTPRRGKLLIRLKSAARSLAKTVSGLKHALRERGATARRACAPRTPQPKTKK